MEKASGINAQLPVAVDEVLSRGLARRQEQRQRSVEEFNRELASALHQQRRRRWLVALTAAAILIAVGIFWGSTLFQGKNPNGGPSSVPHAWIMFEDKETLAGWSDGLAETPKPIRVEGQIPKGQDDPPVPHWPSPRPVLLVHSAEGSGFFHPLFAIESGKEMLTAWPALVQLPHCLPENNLVLVGDFSGKRVWQKDQGPWAQPPRNEWKTGDGIEVACPPNRQCNPALLLDKSNSTIPNRLVCYQWLAQLPAPGTVMVLRYRAWAEAGTGRLSVGPTMPLHIPKDDVSPLAQAL